MDLSLVLAGGLLADLGKGPGTEPLREALPDEDLLRRVNRQEMLRVRVDCAELGPRDPGFLAPVNGVRAPAAAADDSDGAAERALTDFLPERARFLDEETCNLLIPYRDFQGELTAWPESSLRKLMTALSKASGVHVSLQEFRATFGQRAIDSGASVQAVSRCMRHKTTVTTERYYARMRPDDAMNEVRGVLNRLVEVAPRNSVSIDSES